MQQKGSFSMPGKCKISMNEISILKNFWAQAMRPIGHEAGGGIALHSMGEVWYLRLPLLLMHLTGEISAVR